ncbi:hypothetical protein D3C72_1548820 [compost metagenome]
MGFTRWLIALSPHTGRASESPSIGCFAEPPQCRRQVNARLRSGPDLHDGHGAHRLVFGAGNAIKHHTVTGAGSPESQSCPGAACRARFWFAAVTRIGCAGRGFFTSTTSRTIACSFGREFQADARPVIRPLPEGISGLCRSAPPGDSGEAAHASAGGNDRAAIQRSIPRPIRRYQPQS